MDKKTSVEIFKELQQKIIYDPIWYKEAVTWCKENHLDYKLGKDVSGGYGPDQVTPARDNMRYITIRWDYLVEKFNKDKSPFQK